MTNRSTNLIPRACLMHNFRTHIGPINNLPQVECDHKHYFLGSCFSNHIAHRLQQLRFHTLTNPTGILYDPHSLQRHLLIDLQKLPLDQKYFVQRDDFVYSYYHHSQMHAINSGLLLDKLIQLHQCNQYWIQETNFLWLTLGSAIVRTHNSLGIIAANCHKQSGKLFNKSFLNLNELIGEWQDLIHLIKKVNNNLKIIFTVSPVRHIKEGIAENQKSKSILRLLADALVEQFTDVYYYPAYEIMMDDLRDYRFYTADMLHPNDTAINYIFNHYSESFFSTDTQKCVQEINQLNKRLAHKPIQETSRASILFKKETKNLNDALKEKYPKLNWDSIKREESQ